MGDFLVQCDSGNISLDKIKGSNISILGPKGKFILNQQILAIINTSSIYYF